MSLPGESGTSSSCIVCEMHVSLRRILPSADLQAAVAPYPGGNPALTQAAQYRCQQDCESPQWRRQSRSHDRLWLGDCTTAVYRQITLPAQCGACARAPLRQDHAQGTRLHQATDPATIAGHTRRRLDRSFRVDVNDLLHKKAVLSILYKRLGKTRQRRHAYNLVSFQVSSISTRHKAPLA